MDKFSLGVQFEGSLFAIYMSPNVAFIRKKAGILNPIYSVLYRSACWCGTQVREREAL